jgi:type I restriction enzyme R subunit
LDRNAAKEAFADFLQAGGLTADQMTFVNLVIDRVVSSGFVEPRELFGPPFTDQHHEGVAGVLPHRAEDLVARLLEIKLRATPA